MEILIPLAVIGLCIVGMCITSAMRAACREAIRVGDALVAESKRVQAEFDQALQEMQKPQVGDVAERLVFRMEVKGR